MLVNGQCWRWNNVREEGKWESVICVRSLGADWHTKDLVKDSMVVVWEK